MRRAVRQPAKMCPAFWHRYNYDDHPHSHSNMIIIVLFIIIRKRGSYEGESHYMLVTFFYSYFC